MKIFFRCLWKIILNWINQKKLFKEKGIKRIPSFILLFVWLEKKTDFLCFFAFPYLYFRWDICTEWCTLIIITVSVKQWNAYAQVVNFYRYSFFLFRSFRTYLLTKYISIYILNNSCWSSVVKEANVVLFYSSSSCFFSFNLKFTNWVWNGIK